MKKKLSNGSFKSNYRVLGILSLFALLFMFIGVVGSASVPKTIFGIV